MPSFVLIVQNEVGSPPASLVGWARARGVPFEVVHPYQGQELPHTIADHGGLIVLGGEMGAYDDIRFPWLTTTKQLIAEAVVREVPFLGVCLGHQLATVALGGRVGLRPQGPVEGVGAIIPEPELADDPVFSALKDGCEALQWHHDVVSELPTGATVLGRDRSGHPQIVRFGPRAWGLQCQPEVTAEVFEAWIVGRSTAARTANQVHLARVAKQVRSRTPLIHRTWTPVMERFFRLVP